MDGRYAGNAGAIAGELPWMACMPVMQEQLPDMAMVGRVLPRLSREMNRCSKYFSLAAMGGASIRPVV